MSILVHVEAVVRPGVTSHFIEMLRRGLPATRDAKGCQELTAYLHEDGRTFVVIEHWDSKDAYLAYLRWRTETGVLAALEAQLEGPLKIRYFDRVEA